MAWTLADIRIFCRDLDHEDGSTRAQRVYDRIANDANRDLHEAGNFIFDRVRGRLVYPALLSGTCSVSVDGTAVTAGSGFTTADVGKHLRFRGEPTQYLVSAYVGATALTLGEAYRGASAVSAGAFQLTQDRMALPTRFRSMDRVALDVVERRLKFVELDTLAHHRMHRRDVSIPYLWSVEMYATGTQLDAGTSKAPYLWLYPSPSDKRIVEFYYFEWPVEMSDAAHGIGAPQPAEKVHREFIKAHLLLEQGKVQEHQTQMSLAKRMAMDTLSAYRVTSNLDVKREWTPEADEGESLNGFPGYEMPVGPNEGA